ncbi:hypothetical protein B0T25DRAFT_612111 [Lasiosphaeria hispida]|uniref:Transcription factor domain-containing protein n=1 Tax=Lasiosphaeria hispida TaxID=260671 RepID=A0AAJ0HAY8_9PEZI|nr:hypothetical protein B0T25DRAFT_612111 [Lasiosphaeria hispida]
MSKSRTSSDRPQAVGTGGRQFQFISVQDPDDAEGGIKGRLVRSHAVAQGLERKRRLQQASGNNFIVTTSKSYRSRGLVSDLKTGSRRGRVPTPNLLSVQVSAGALDPFQSLAVDSSRLQALLSNYKARQSPEPVFTLEQDFAFQNFRSVFLTGFLIDPAILSAAMLSFAFAVTGGTIDQECLGYQSQAISHIRTKISSPSEATSESTIGAILLLAGVEARLGRTSQVQLHMGAVQHLLQACKTERVYLTGGIKRAIFWQDLNSSILSGSQRIADHTTFAELQWTRDLFSPHYFRLPPGFEAMRPHLLTDSFVQVLQDIQALQCIRDFSRSTDNDVMSMARINNHIASIQSRLVALADPCPVLQSCHLAAYLCSVMLCCKVWCALVIPAHVSSQLLGKLQQSANSLLWDHHPELLLWVSYIGGSFAPKGSLRSGYTAHVRSNNTTRFKGLNGSWPNVLETLEQFIWSEKAFTPAAGAFWEETWT